MAKKRKRLHNPLMGTCDELILNVGGRTFSTCLATLANDKQSMLWARFGKDAFPTRMFIDRDGDLFHHILYFLRTGQLSHRIRPHTSLLRDLYTEAEYYCLHSLCTLLQRRIELNTTKAKTVLLRESSFHTLQKNIREYEKNKHLQLRSFHIHNSGDTTWHYATLSK